MWITVPFVLAGCATGPAKRGPSEYLLSVDRGVTASLRDLRVKLEEEKYVVGREDLDAGFLILKPRTFSFERNGSKVVARQFVQIRQEGGSVKVRLSYECKYEMSFDACDQDDEGARAKISRLERPLLDLLRPILLENNKTAAERPKIHSEKKESF